MTPTQEAADDGLSEGDEITVYNREAEVLAVYDKKIKVRFANGTVGYDYRARHEAPDTCRKCDQEATHRVSINAPGNGDVYGACPECAAEAKGRYTTVEEVEYV